jgi:hypothetical protein
MRGAGSIPVPEHVCSHGSLERLSYLCRARAALRERSSIGSRVRTAVDALGEADDAVPMTRDVTQRVTPCIRSCKYVTGQVYR